MQLFLYKVSEAENVLNKTLGTPIELNINLKSDTDVIRPDLILKSINGVDFNDFNYCHIPVLKRYYFINSIDNLNAKLWRFRCECDVLMIYKNDILNSKARLKRNIRNGDYLNTDIESSIIKTVSSFNSEYVMNDDKTLILTTVGV